jgi:hypothetical protein
MQRLQEQVVEMSTQVEALEKERDFYFSKVLSFFFRSCTPAYRRNKATKHRDPCATAGRGS